MRILVPSLLCSLILVAAEHPSAAQVFELDEGAVTIGPLASLGRHYGGPATTGLGVEMTANSWLRGACVYGIMPCDYFVGVVGQAQVLGGGRARLLLGPQAGIGPFGVEVGPAIETRTDDYATTLSAHVAPFISFGVGSLGARFGIPLATLSSGRMYGAEAALTLTAKIPFRFSHGRFSSEAPKPK